MLPTSHPSPINALRGRSGPSSINVVGDYAGTADLERQGTAAPAGMSLSEAFSEFILASSRLERSYQQLQAEVSELTHELAERNAALESSLAENELMQLSLQRMVAAMPCGVLVVDGSGAILTINPEGRRLLGIADDALVPAALEELPAWRHLDLHHLYAAGAQQTEQELCISGADGKRWLELRNRKLPGRGLPVGSGSASTKSQPSPKRRDHAQTVLILRDISSQKRTERDREAALREVTLAGITTILAHEIRNPLAALELFTGLIAQDGLSNPIWTSHLRAGIRSLSATVNNVLSFHGACPMALAPLDLAAAIEAGVEFVRPLAEQAGVSLCWAGVEGTHAGRSDNTGCGGPAVLGSGSALQQVVLNLVSNAIRHTPAGGSIRIQVREAGPSAPQAELTAVPGCRSIQTRTIVEFRDTGCGIAPALAERIFEPGFSAGGGTPGLGLAVCRTIMQQHGGSIRVTSPASSGATFELEFPLL